MATFIEFKKLSDDELTRTMGKAKSFTGNFPKKSLNATEAKAKLKGFQDISAKAAPPQVKLSKIKAISIKASDIAGLRAISLSSTPTAEALVGQKMDPDKVIGTLFTSLTTLEYTKMESEFRTRMKAATSPAAKAKVQAEWNTGIKAFKQAFASAGLKDVKDADLKKFSDELLSNKANFNAIVNIANTAVPVAGLKPVQLTAQSVLSGGFVTVTGIIKDTGTITTAAPGLCSKPFVEGNFTKHFHKGFSLTVRIPYPCPTWTDWFRICHKNVTLAGLSLDLNLQVGYKVTCCGATAFGRVSAQVCASVVGIRFCAGCTAQITGVAGIGRTGTGSNCTYGIGLNAQLTCTFGGITVLNVQAPFGFNVSGPCPPAGFCN